MAEELNMVNGDLDLDNIDLDDIVDGDDLASMDLSSFGEIDDTVDYPNFKVSTKSFKEFLKVAKLVCTAGGKDVVSKAVCLFVEGENLLCASTDFDVYVEMTIPLLNDHNILDEVVVIPTDILTKLTRAVPVNTVIYKKDDKFYIRLYGGDIVLETYSMMRDKFIFSDSLVSSEQISSKDLADVMKDFSPIVIAAVSPAERRIICESDRAYASYLFAIIMAKKSFTACDLKPKDINVLKSLVVNSDETLKTYHTADDVSPKRCQVVGENFKYTFLLSDAKISDSMKKSISNVVTADGVFVDFVQLYKMVEVAAELPYSTGKIGINYSDEGIKLAIKTKKDSDAIFDISGSKEGNTTPINDELIVQAKLFRVVLKSFASKSSIRLTVTKDGIGVSADDYSAAIYSEAV